jgi:hypothetical protein
LVSVRDRASTVNTGLRLVHLWASSIFGFAAL